MKLLMLGVNHRTASVELRERLALSGEKVAAVLSYLRSGGNYVEAVVLSTCNRTEIYLARPAHEPPKPEDIIDFLSQFCGVDRASIAASQIQRENEQVVAHLFRVCSGLDSMVLGESQILGQVKRAYEEANACGAVGPVLHRVFQQAVAVAKQARTETGIDTGRLSVGSAAVDFARQIFERFDDKIVLGIGAGDMAKLTLRHLMALQPSKLLLTNRTPERAHALAQKLALPNSNGSVRPFDALDDLLVEADIVITSTGSQQPIITAERFRPVLKRRRFRPLFIIDIALPRDVEPEVGSLSNVYLYNLDDLQKVVEQTHGQRSQQVERCEAILLEAVRACYAEIQNRDVGQLIRALRRRLHDVGAEEQQRTLRKLAADPDDAAAILDEHTQRLINKILHLPLSQLDRRQHDAPLGFYAAALRRLFDLHEPRPGEAETPPTLSTDAPAAPTPAAPPSPPSRDAQHVARPNR